VACLRNVVSAAVILDSEYFVWKNIFTCITAGDMIATDVEVK
jgi:hypothetical protein